MKTPKRHYDLTTMEHSASERVWDRPQEEVSAQRWRRKNRVKQLKRTITRLNRELALFIETENFALICDALVTHAASSDDRTTELRCLHLLTSLAKA